MRGTFKITFFLTFFLISFFLFMPQVLADGAIFLYDPDIFFWRIQNEDQQLCAINHENGKQNMILAVDVIDLEGDKAVWMFPVPSGPDETEIDIIKGFPELLGYDILEEKNEVISGYFIVMRLTQVYTLPALFFLLISQSTFGAALPGEGKGITVHEHMEKMGLTTELITAEDGNAFYSYLTGKGFHLPPEAETILDEYTGEKYTFVISWISDVEQFKNESGAGEYYGEIMDTIGVYVSFPTEKIYFPMKPTSVYGDREIPILIYVIGLVTPELYPGITQHTQVNYFQDRYNVPYELSNFFNGKERIDDLKYTKIKVEAPSNALTKDLWINDSVPQDVIKADFMSTNMWWWGIIILIVSSCLASMLAGMFIYRKDKPDIIKFTLFGLANFITLIGFALLAYTIGMRKRFTRARKAEMKDVKPGKSIKTAAIIALVPSVIIFSLPIFLFMSLYLDFYVLTMIIPIIILFVIMFLLILPFVHIFYRDRRLFKFIFLFSVLFLAITLPFELALLFAI